MRTVLLSIAVEVNGEDRKIAKALYLLRQLGARVGVVVNYEVLPVAKGVPPLRDELAALEREVSKQSPAYRS